MLFRLSALFLLIALLPAVFLGAAGRELSPRQPAPTTYMTTEPAVAFAGERFLTVWTESVGELGSHVRGAFSDANGVRITPVAFTIVPNVAPTWTTLVATGDSFALFFEDRAGMVRMVDIDGEGRVIAERTLMLPRHPRPRIAWNGSRFLYALSQIGRSEAYLLDRSGAVVRESIALRGDVRAVAAMGETFVAFTDQAGLEVHWIANDGAVESKRVDVSGSAFRSFPMTVVAVPLPGGAMIVAWNDDAAVHERRLLTAIIEADRTIGAPQLIASGNGVVTPLALRPALGGFVLAMTRRPPHEPFGVLTTVSLGGSGERIGTIAEGPEVRWAAAASSTAVTLLAVSIEWSIRVTGLVMTGSGRLSEPETLSVAYARQTQPVLAAGGGRLLAIYNQLDGDYATVRSASLNADGEPLERHVIASSFAGARELAWSGSEFLIVHHSGGKLMANRVDVYGAPIDREPIVLSAPFQRHWSERPAAVAWIGDRWAVAWREHDRLVYSTVSRSGVATAPRSIALPAPLPPEHYRGVETAAIAFDGTRILLVWREVIAPVCYFPGCFDEGKATTYAMFLTADGTPTGAAPVLPGRSGELSIATSGSEFVIVGGGYAMTVRASGNAPQLTALREKISGDVTWDGRDYVVAHRYRVLQWYVSVQRMNAALADTAPPRGIATATPDAAEPPSVAAVLAGEVVVALQEGEPDSGARAVVYRERDLAPLPAPPSVPRNVRTTALGGGKWETTWDAPATGEVEAYAYEVRGPNGTLNLSGRLPAGTRRLISDASDVRIRAMNAGGWSAFVGDSRRRAAGR